MAEGAITGKQRPLDGAQEWVVSLPDWGTEVVLTIQEPGQDVRHRLIGRSIQKPGDVVSFNYGPLWIHIEHVMDEEE